MGTLSDDRFQALRDQGFTGSTSDMLLQWLQDAGATAKAIPDAWREVLVDALGVGPADSYQRNDYWFEWLGSQGYEGALPDREAQFWADGGALSTAQYFWNPTTPGGASSATFAAWTPSGTSYTLKARFRITDVDESDATVLGGDASARLYRSLDELIFVYPLAAGGTRSVNLGVIAQDQDYAFEARFTPDGVSILLDGEEEDDDWQVVAAAAAHPGHSVISGTTALVDPWVGFISNVEMLDESVLRGGTYQLGDSTFWGELDVGIPLTADFEIEFNWVRTDRTGTANQLLLSANNSSPHLFTLNVQDSGGSPANRVQIGFNNAFASFAGALDDVAQGQHITMRLTRVGTTMRCYVDGNEVSSSPVNNFTQAGTYVDRVGVNHNNGVRFVGSIGNLVIKTDPQPYRGFLEFGASHPDVIDAFTNTSGSDVGDTETIAATFDPVKGAKYTNLGSFGRWNEGAGSFNAATWNDIRSNGWTMQFEVEKELFAASYAETGNDVFLLVSGGSENHFAYRRANFFEWIEDATGAPVPGDRLRTYDDEQPDFVRVDVSFNNATNTFDLYVEKFLLGSWTLAGSKVWNNISWTGVGGAFGVNNHPFFIRNVQLCLGPIERQAINRRRVCFLSDSFGTWSQYQNDTVTDNDPALTGVAIGDTQYDAPPTAANPQESRNVNLFARLHKAFVEKGYQLEAVNNQGANAQLGRIEYYGRSGSTVGPIAYVDKLEQRIDAAFGTAGDPPNGSTGYDVYLILIGTNDVNMAGLQPDPTAYIDSVVAEYQGQLDRLRAADPDCTIIISSVVDKYTNSSSGDNPSLVNQFNAKWSSELDGYAGAILVDIHTGWGQNLTVDTVHPNLAGMKHLADRFAAAIPALTLEGYQTYTFPLNEGSGTRMNNTDPVTGGMGGTWTAENWVPIDNNDRRYRMNEGTGATLGDSGDPGGKDATISPFDESNWQEPP